MEKSKIYLIAAIFFTTNSFALNQKPKNEAFQRGEKLTFSCYYDALLTGQVKAGTADFEITKENKKINNRSTLHIQAIGKTKGLFNLFFKVVDRYESYVDEEDITPLLFIRRVDEGGYTLNQDIVFNRNKNQALYTDNKSKRTATIATSDDVHDIMSAIYYSRTIDYSKAKPNDAFKVKFMLEDTIYTTRIIYLGKETINTGLGKIKCFKIKPQVLIGTIFKEKFPITLWVSDDKNKLPIMLKAGILVGSVKMELIDYSGLRNPFSSKE